MKKFMRKFQSLFMSSSIPESTLKEDETKATCPICAANYAIDTTKNLREGKLCPSCGASGRSSAIVHHLCMIIYKNNTPLCKQPDKKDWRIAGLSDGPAYCKLLEEKYDYINTFFHKEPFLDITNPEKKHLLRYDILISTEVFEHVIGPSLLAFKGAINILKPGGHLILTVPFVNKGESSEHYPGIKNYHSEKKPDGSWIARIEFEDGRIEVDGNPRFHGGPGKTLELRLFNRERVLKELAEAGFQDIIVHDSNLPSRGINWGPASRVITARRPLDF